MVQANKTLCYNYKREVGQNPYTGIVSFQHFRGEKLYSDIVVKPENNRCETENVECYPVPSYVPENGRNEGYYPDSSVAYIRVLWKEFEPVQGQYNYGFIEDILKEARAHSQTVAFRLMAHSTRACDDVPDWLKTLIPCPERPEGKRVKDSPTDPLFIDLFCKAVQKIGERFDTDPTLSTVDISLPGSWGEGHKLENYSDEDIQKLFDTYTAYFPNTILMGQLARPAFVKRAAKIVPTGWRGDGLGEPTHTANIYPPRVAELADHWKTAPVSFESYWWLCEWQRQGWELAPIIEKTLQWHISSFNPKSIPIPPEWQEQIEYWISKMGYHYQIDSFQFPETMWVLLLAIMKCIPFSIWLAAMAPSPSIQIRMCGIGVWARQKTNMFSSCPKLWKRASIPSGSASQTRWTRRSSSAPMQRELTAPML